MVILVHSKSRAAAGDTLFNLMRTAPAGLKLLAFNGNLAAASASLENLDAAMSHLTALTGTHMEFKLACFSRPAVYAMTWICSHTA